MLVVSEVVMFASQVLVAVNEGLRFACNRYYHVVTAEVTLWPAFNRVVVTVLTECAITNAVTTQAYEVELNCKVSPLVTKSIDIQVPILVSPQFDMQAATAIGQAATIIIVRYLTCSRSCRWYIDRSSIAALVVSQPNHCVKVTPNLDNKFNTNRAWTLRVIGVEVEYPIWCVATPFVLAACVLEHVAGTEG